MILALGISPNFFEETEGFAIQDGSNIKYGNIDVKDIASNQNSFLIMKTESMPYAFTTQLSDEESKDLVEVDSETHLYSNIDNISTTDLTLYAKIGFKVVLPRPFKYIRIKVGYELAEDDISISRIEPISNYIV